MRGREITLVRTGQMGVYKYLRWKEALGTTLFSIHWVIEALSSGYSVQSVAGNFSAEVKNE
jgi:hypothetical protein